MDRLAIGVTEGPPLTERREWSPAVVTEAAAETGGWPQAEEEEGAVVEGGAVEGKDGLLALMRPLF